MIRHVVPMVAGAVAFASVQFVLLQRAGPPLSDSAGWFLNSGTNVNAICVAVAIAAGVVALASRANLVTRAAACLAGAIFAMVVVLFATGAGSIFPIVIVFGGVVLGAAVAAGTVAVEAVRRLAGLLSTR